MQCICDSPIELKVVREFEDELVNCDVCITEQMTYVFQSISPLAPN